MATSPAYLDGLKMLARRELSEQQVRQRLARHGHPPEDIEGAISALRRERAIDDARVAEAIARTETSVHRHGKRRVRAQIERAGVDRSVASRAVDDVFAALDPANPENYGKEDALLEASLAKRLRGRDQIADDREFQRLYRYLIGQGFEPDRILAALNRRAGRRG